MSGVSVDLGCSPAHENGSLSPSLPLFVIKAPGPSLLHTSLTHSSEVSIQA